MNDRSDGQTLRRMGSSAGPKERPTWKLRARRLDSEKRRRKNMPRRRRRNGPAVSCPAGRDLSPRQLNYSPPPARASSQFTAPQWIRRIFSLFNSLLPVDWFQSAGQTLRNFLIRPNEKRTDCACNRVVVFGRRDLYRPSSTASLTLIDWWR